jgi:hypothetical protein
MEFRHRNWSRYKQVDSAKQELDVVGEATSTGVGEASAVAILGLLRFAVLMLALEYLVFHE